MFKLLFFVCAIFFQLTQPSDVGNSKKIYKYTSHAKNIGNNFSKRYAAKYVVDQYTLRRGEPKMLRIYCDDCDSWVMDYQKDGPGRLLRCYLDRIDSPSQLRERVYDFDLRTTRSLRCPECELKIGTPTIYKQENRPAYHLVKNTCYFHVIE